MPVELVVPSVGDPSRKLKSGLLKKEASLSIKTKLWSSSKLKKVTVELPAPTTGTITTMLKQKGQGLSGDVIGYMEPNGVKTRTRRTEYCRTKTGRPAVAEASQEPDSKAPPSISPPATGREEQIIP